MTLARSQPAQDVGPSPGGWPPTAVVPGGVFQVGSDYGRPDERPRRLARVDAFALGLTPVTCDQFRAFLDDTGEAPPPCFDDADFNQPDQPVTSVTWFEAAAFAEWLGARRGGRWRLPSETEWERAARAGADLDPPGAPPAGEVPEGSLRGPWRVARGTPNAYGLFDLGTIVHEWCADWYAAPRPASALGPASLGRRASRGGSWRHHVRWSPPAARSSLPPTFRYADYGFRVLRELP